MHSEWTSTLAFTEETFATDIEVTTTNSSTWVPTHSFAAGALSAFTVTAISELGDKTFFIAVVLALSHPPLVVLSGALSALGLMTALSAALGLVSALIPDVWVQVLSGTLFLIFGIKMLREGRSLGDSAAKEEMETVQKTIDAKKTDEVSEMESNQKRKSRHWKVFLEAFAMTFLAEWGDRSQFTTVVLAAKHSVLGVIVGAILGHAVCTSLAVIGGRLIADKISLKVVSIFGGLLFIGFAIWCFVTALLEMTS